MRTLPIVRSLLIVACATPIALSAGLTTVTQAKTSFATDTPQTTANGYAIDNPPPIKWPGGTSLTVKPGIPFAWLREEAYSAAGLVATVFPGTPLVATAVDARWDGVQWWAYIFAPGVYEPDILGYWGWVEQNALQLADKPLPPLPPLPTEPPVSWPDGTLLTIKPGIPFAWLRGQASSAAGVVATVFPGQSLVGTGEDARWDGLQWWGYVHTPGIVGDWGWVEQNSLQSATPPTETSPTQSVMTPSACVASYSGQVAIAFLNYRTSTIWIDGLDANCHEFHMWSMLGNQTSGEKLTLPPGMLTVRIRDYASNQLLAQYTISGSMNGTSISIH